MKVLILYTSLTDDQSQLQIYKQVSDGLFDAGHKIEKIILAEHTLNVKNKKSNNLISDISAKITTVSGLVIIAKDNFNDLSLANKQLLESICTQKEKITKEKVQVKIPIIKKHLSTPIVHKIYKYRNIKKIAIITSTTHTESKTPKKLKFSYIVKKLLYKVSRPKKLIIRYYKQTSKNLDNLDKVYYRFGRKF